MKKLISFFMFFTLIFSLFSKSYALEDKPYISAESGILIDYESGKVLYSKNIHKKMYPASTTKIMTALLVLENSNLKDKVHIDYNLGFVDGNSMFIKKGETFTVEELLKVLLIRSANDSAVVLANYISGSVEDFAKLMNERAKSLGCKNTNFVNPNGLPDKNHYTSAYDLALISREAMKYDKFREIVKSPSIQIAPTELTPEGRRFKNSNRFLWGTGGRNMMEYEGKVQDIKYEVIDGIKTGYTKVARQCLSTSAVKDNLRLICIVLKCDGKDIYINSRKLIDYGFRNYHSEKILMKNKLLGNSIIKNSKEKNLEFAPISDFNLTLSNDEDIKNVNKKIVLNKNLKAPIKKGDIIGEVEIYNKEKLISKVKLKSLNNISKTSLKNTFYSNINYLHILKISLFVFLMFFIIIFIQIYTKKNRRRKKYKKRR